MRQCIRELLVALCSTSLVRCTAFNDTIASSIRARSLRARSTVAVAPPVRRRTILLVLVTGASIGSPTVTPAELYQRVFSDAHSLQHQMAQCSAGQLQLDPLTEYGSTGTGTTGILAVHVDAIQPVSVTTPRAKIVEVAHTAALQLIRRGNNVSNQITNLRQLAHHVMFILPQSRHIDDTFVASAEICPSQQPGTSVYGDRHALSLSVLMHEIGHNLALHHARGPTDSESAMYADQTGSMGHSTPDIGGPLACYNAANHWSLQWYTHQRLELSVSSTPSTASTLVTVAAFVDHARLVQNGMVVLVKVDHLFLQYNRAKDYNAGTRDRPNQLVVTRHRTSGNGGGGGTMLVAGLDAAHPTFTDGLVSIHVCRVDVEPSTGIDYMVVSLGRHPGATTTECTDASGPDTAVRQSGPAAPTPERKPASWRNHWSNREARIPRNETKWNPLHWW